MYTITFEKDKVAPVIMSNPDSINVTEAVDKGRFIIRKAADLGKLSSSQLVATYNLAPLGNVVTKFTNKATGVKRVWPRLAIITGGDITIPGFLKRKPSDKKATPPAPKERAIVMPKNKAGKSRQQKDTLKTEKKAAKLQAKLDKKPTYSQMLRQIFQPGVKLTMDEVAEALGSDRRNAAVAIWILKTPSRTKNPMTILRNPKSKTYSVVT